MNQPTQSTDKVEEILIKLHHDGWVRGKKQVETPYSYTLELEPEKSAKAAITHQLRIAELRGQVKELDFLSSGFYTEGDKRDMSQSELAERMRSVQAQLHDLEEEVK